MLIFKTIFQKVFKLDKCFRINKMGNCLDRTLSDDAEDDIVGAPSSEESSSNRSRSSRQRSHSYTRILDHSSSSSLVSLNCPVNNNNSHRIPSGAHSIHDPSSYFVRSYTNSQFLNDTHSSSLPINLQIPISSSVGLHTSLSSSLPSNSSSTQQVFYLAPNIQRTADQLTEEEQIKLLKRVTLIQQLPSGSYDESKKNKE